MTQDAFRYWAFISYSHADRRFADRLHGSLERVQLTGRARLPAGAPSSSCLAPVFLDRVELAASPNLERDLLQALNDSMWLVVIVSDAAAASSRVEAEIDAFALRWSVERIILVIRDGEERALASEPFVRLTGPRVRVRPSAGDAGALGVAATLMGEDVRHLQRRRRRRILATTIGVVAMAWLGAIATRDLLQVGHEPSGQVKPWIGRWEGSVESSCGYYSGRVTQVITAAGDDQIRIEAYIEPGDQFAASVTLRVMDQEATSESGQHLSLKGDTITGTYPPACQTGSTRRR